ncbi:sulfite oxidase [Alkalihalobacillus deserti]|uniref:sulfite oxidase n=1 Tax=Alkalihalobacillus deserti TaxID=2879466 RepID=UPI001D15DD88|nr:sulfite oxidase [Alkalihalobacillus deserti]
MSNSPDRFVKPTLTTQSLNPDNKETPISFMNSDLIGQKLLYKRNHFSYPTLTYSNYWLPINGLVTTPKVFSLQDIVNFPSKTQKVVLECAGNKRSLFTPKVFGEQWGKGAISQGYWTGVPLKDLLQTAGILEGVTEVIFEGYDSGKKTDLDHIYSYSRSLPLEKALHPDTLIAYEYNYQPIPFKHGFPLRLIVPQWYGMASVKWIKQIRLINGKFKGPFQSVDYVFYPHVDNDEDAYPVTMMHVNSTIQKPLDRQILTTGTHLIKGIAWTGKETISKVEISTDNGETWSNIELLNKDHYEWTSWVYKWSVLEKGEYTIMTRATDSCHRTQPDQAFWNRKGYGYNAIDHITVKIE